MRHCGKRLQAEQWQHCRGGGRGGRGGEAVVHDSGERVVVCKSKKRSVVYFGMLVMLKKQLAYIKPTKIFPNSFYKNIMGGFDLYVPPS